MLPLASRMHRYLIRREHIRYTVYAGMKLSSGDMKCSKEAVRGQVLESARCGESNEVLKWWAGGMVVGSCDEVVAGREIK